MCASRLAPDSWWPARSSSDARTSPASRVKHSGEQAALEPKFWKITGSVTPILAATSDTFPVNAAIERSFHPERLLLTLSGRPPIPREVD
jgi:hypothetical protein